MYFTAIPGNDAAMHFAYEELFTRYIRLKSPVIMLWQTEKTVMLGNNQAFEAELDVDFAKENNINIIRRSSGGGAIYTDKGTVQYSFIEPLIYETNIHRENLAEKIIKILKKIEIKAEQKGRNDILVNGKKISGLAQYTSGKHICTHGSLLYETDIDLLSRVLTVNESKLLPKGISSVRSRVTNIKPLIGDKNISCDDFILYLKRELTNDNNCSDFVFTDNDMQKANEIYNEKYTDPGWNLRK